MTLRWTPTFVYGPDAAPVTLALSLPVALWRHSSRSVGVMRRTATRIPGVTVSQRTQCLTVPLRFFESEWPAVRALIEWGQTKAPFTWIPDADPYSQDQLPVTATVTLVSPKVGDPIAPEPDAIYPRVLSLALTFRQIEPGGES